MHVDDCFRSSRTRVVCWLKDSGYTRSGRPYACAGEVRVIEYWDHYSIAPKRHGRYGYQCERL
jgi:hypothetical protein